jgi:acylphosphatase
VIHNLIAYNLVVSGRVQGVGYRCTARRLAELTGVKGWVKNLSTGDVELHIEHANESALDVMIVNLKHEPSSAYVKDIMISRVDPEGFSEFTIEF